MVGVGLWLLFILLVPRREWPALYPTLVFSGLLATVADLLGVTYLQWEYIGPTTGGLSLWADLAFAPPQGGVAVYLQKRFPRWAWLNWLFWIGINALGERLFVQWGLIRYHQWDSFKATLFYFPFFALIYLQERWWRQKMAKPEERKNPAAVGSRQKRSGTNDRRRRGRNGE